MSTPQSVRPLQDAGYAGILFVFGAYGLWVEHLHRLGRDAAGLHLHHIPTCFLCALMICATFILTAIVASRARGPACEEGRISLMMGKHIGGVLFTACLLWAWTTPGMSS